MRSPIFSQKLLTCSYIEIEWRNHGFAGGNLAYLFAACGLFYDAHRAADDCHAVLEILAKALPGSPMGRPGGAACPRAKTVFQGLGRAVAVRSERRSETAWLSVDGSPHSLYVDVGEEEHPAEIAFLRTEIYQREVDVRSLSVTALERFQLAFDEL